MIPWDDLDFEIKRAYVPVEELFIVMEIFCDVRDFRVNIFKNWDRVVGHEGDHDQHVEDGTYSAVATVDSPLSVPRAPISELMREDVHCD